MSDDFSEIPEERRREIEAEERAAHEAETVASDESIPTLTRAQALRQIAHEIDGRIGDSLAAITSKPETSRLTGDETRSKPESDFETDETTRAGDFDGGSSADHAAAPSSSKDSGTVARIDDGSGPDGLVASASLNVDAGRLVRLLPALTLLVASACVAFAAIMLGDDFGVRLVSLSWWWKAQFVIAVFTGGAALVELELASGRAAETRVSHISGLIVLVGSGFLTTELIWLQMGSGAFATEQDRWLAAGGIAATISVGLRIRQQWASSTAAGLYPISVRGFLFPGASGDTYSVLPADDGGRRPEGVYARVAWPVLLPAGALFVAATFKVLSSLTPGDYGISVLSLGWWWRIEFAIALAAVIIAVIDFRRRTGKDSITVSTQVVAHSASIAAGFLLGGLAYVATSASDGTGIAVWAALSGLSAVVAVAALGRERWCGAGEDLPPFRLRRATPDRPDGGDSARSAEDRLFEIDRLFAAGLIDTETAAELRRKVLGEI